MSAVDDMSLFARVVAAGSFTEVARELEVSRSLVSKRLGALEKRLGVRLLHRTTRSLSLTEAGEAYHRHCVAVGLAVEQAEAEVAEMGQGLHGRLRLTAPVTFGERFVAPALARFLALHPALSVDLQLTDRFVDLVGERIDLAVRIGVLEDSSLVARRLGDCPMAVCAAPGYLERHGEPTVPEELTTHNCLTYWHERQHSDRWLFSGEQGPYAISVRGSLRCDSGTALCEAACAGLGLTYLPRFIVAPALADGRLRTVLDQHGNDRQGIFAVYPPSRALPAKTRALLDFLAEWWALTAPL